MTLNWAPMGECTVSATLQWAIHDHHKLISIAATFKVYCKSIAIDIRSMSI